MTDTYQRPGVLLTVGVLALGGFAAITTMVALSPAWLGDLDRRIGAGPQAFTAAHPRLADVGIIVGQLTGTKATVAVMALLVAVLWWKKYPRAAVFTAIVMLLVGGVVQGIKMTLTRPRPVWDEPIQTLTSHSYPSGHTTSIVAAAGVVIVLAVMLLRRTGLRRLVIGAALAVSLLVAADRIFLGVHHFSDVAGGACLGTAIVTLVLAAFDPTPRVAALKNAAPLPQPLPSSRRLGVVLNPAKVAEEAAFVQMVTELATEAGWHEVLWWRTTVADTGHQMARDALASQVDLVLAVGGDGTVSAVCQELIGSGIPIGIIPAGTGNLLARNLDIPLYLRNAVATALHGQDFAIDLVEVEGDELDKSIFLVMAGMGFDAAIMQGVNEDFKKHIGWLAYVWSALKALMFPAIRVDVSIDGGEFTRHRARTVVIGNVGYLQAGMPLIPDAAIDDGQLDVVLLYPRRLLSWLPLAARVLTKNRRTDEAITRMRGAEVVIRTPFAAPRQLDGDVVAPGKELRARCVHGPILVRTAR